MRNKLLWYLQNQMILINSFNIKIAIYSKKYDVMWLDHCTYLQFVHENFLYTVFLNIPFRFKNIYLEVECKNKTEF